MKTPFRSTAGPKNNRKRTRGRRKFQHRVAVDSRGNGVRMHEFDTAKGHRLKTITTYA